MAMEYKLPRSVWPDNRDSGPSQSASEPIAQLTILQQKETKETKNANIEINKLSHPVLELSPPIRVINP
jgi:hypothetical protein